MSSRKKPLSEKEKLERIKSTAIDTGLFTEEELSRYKNPKDISAELKSRKKKKKEWSSNPIRREAIRKIDTDYLLESDKIFEESGKEVAEKFLIKILENRDQDVLERELERERERERDRKSPPPSIFREPVKLRETLRHIESRPLTPEELEIIESPEKIANTLKRLCEEGGSWEIDHYLIPEKLKDILKYWATYLGLVRGEEKCRKLVGNNLIIDFYLSCGVGKTPEKDLHDFGKHVHLIYNYTTGRCSYIPKYEIYEEGRLEKRDGRFTHPPVIESLPRYEFLIDLGDDSFTAEDYAIEMFSELLCSEEDLKRGLVSSEKPVVLRSARRRPLTRGKHKGPDPWAMSRR